MSEPKPRPYAVEMSRSENAEAVIWATSAEEAERIAWANLDIQWTFSAGDITRMPKARMLRGQARIYNADYGYHPEATK